VEADGKRQERGKRPIGGFFSTSPAAWREATCLRIKKSPPRPLPQAAEGTPAIARGPEQIREIERHPHPQALAAERAEAARKTPVDRSKYRTVRTL